MCMKDNLPDRADGPLIMVIGDRSEPLMLALLDLEASRPGMLDNLIEVLPSDGSDLSITEIRLLRPPYMKSILRGLACFETGSVSVFPYRFSDLLGYGNILENQIAFSTCDKVKQLRLFKNGRVDLKFSSEQTAADFVDTYLGTVY